MTALILVILVICLSQCEQEDIDLDKKSGIVSSKKVKKKNSTPLKSSFGDIDKEKRIELQSYKLEIIEQLKNKLDRELSIDQCNTKSPIIWQFRWHPKDGYIDANILQFSSKSEDTLKRRECILSILDKLNVKIPNTLPISYINLEVSLE